MRLLKELLENFLEYALVMAPLCFQHYLTIPLESARQRL